VDDLEAGQRPSRDPQVDCLEAGRKSHAGPESAQVAGGEAELPGRLETPGAEPQRRLGTPGTEPN